MFPTDLSVKSIFSLNSQQDRPKCLTVPNACCQAVSCVNFFHHSTPLSHTFHGHLSVFCHNVCLLPLNHLVCWFSLFSLTFDCLSFLISYHLPYIFTWSYLSLPLAGSSTFSVLFLLYHGSVFDSFVPICTFINDIFLTSCNMLLRHFNLSSSSSAASDQDAQEEGEKSKECDFCSRNKISPLLKPNTLSPNLPLYSKNEWSTP